MTVSRVVAAGQLREYLEAQLRLALQDPNAYFAELVHGRSLREDPRGREIVVEHWIRHAGSKYDQWCDAVSADQRALILGASSEDELKQLIDSGRVPDPVHWFEYREG